MLRPFLAIIFALGLYGCGGGSDVDLATVEGTVTLGGKPLPNATVLFTPTEGGRPSSAVTDDDGRYELMFSPGNYGATPGTYRVSISSATTISDEQGNDVEVPEKVPAKYNANTELTREVKGGENQIDFKLDSEGPIYEESTTADEGGITC